MSGQLRRIGVNCRREVLAAGAVLLLAACAGASHPRGPIPDFASRLDQAPNMSDDEVTDYITDLADERLTAICGDRQTLRTQRECIREAVYRGFDTTGLAREKCDSQTKLNLHFRCVVVGTLIQEMAARAKIDVADDLDWNASKEEFKEIARSAGDAIMSPCDDATLATLDRCLVERVGVLLALSEEQVTICTDETDTVQTKECLLHMFMIQHFETAIRRMGSGVGQGA